ncbi:MAG: hypothetical protein HUJ88_12935 [Fusobacterium necrophorum]|nr:hypothetical protein [Fusobacterium necrophorum]
MKIFKYCFVLIFILILTACGEKGIYDYSDNDKYDLLIAAYIDGEQEAVKKIEDIEIKLHKDYRRTDSRKKAEEQLKLWEAQKDIVLSIDLRDKIGEFEKAYKSGKGNEFIDELIEEDKKIKSKK